MSAKKNIAPIIRDTLVNNASLALKNLDVPIGAVLLYNNKIIGVGYNTMMRDKNISGHAEINAINEAITRHGIGILAKLKSDSTSLISTYEPCMMCKGMIQEQGIKHVLFMKEKSWYHWLHNDIKALKYDMQKRQVKGGVVQDSLFMLHPHYPEKNKQ
ncbi:MAG: nucleoside deaminase [Flavobacterium sp.]|nr:nucleoside deaminase [Flavobacterium sp.]